MILTQTVRLIDNLIGLYQNFANTTKPTDGRIQQQRASVAQYWDSVGRLSEVAAGVSRAGPYSDHDITTLESRGYLAEPARINLVPNNTCVSAVSGTPGTMPDGWNAAGTQHGLSRQVVGVGVEDGMEYFDIRYSGLASADSAMVIGTGSNSAGSVGQHYASSVFAKIVGGTMPGQFYLTLYEFDAGAVFLRSHDTPKSLASSGALRLARVEHNATIGASTATVSQVFFFTYTNGQLVDITIRFSLAQLELVPFAAAVASHPIKTSGAAAGRLVDVMYINGVALTSIWNMDAGSVIREFASKWSLMGAAQHTLSTGANDGTGDNALYLRAATDLAAPYIDSNGRVNAASAWDTGNASFAGGVTGVFQKQGISFQDGAVSEVVNGGAPQTASPAEMPYVHTFYPMIVDGDGGGAWLKTLTITRSSLSNSQLQALT